MLVSSSPAETCADKLFHWGFESVCVSVLEQSPELFTRARRKPTDSTRTQNEQLFTQIRSQRTWERPSVGFGFPFVCSLNRLCGGARLFFDKDAVEIPVLIDRPMGAFVHVRRQRFKTKERWLHAARITQTSSKTTHLAWETFLLAGGNLSLSGGEGQTPFQLHDSDFFPWWMPAEQGHSMQHLPRSGVKNTSKIFLLCRYFAF